MQLTFTHRGSNFPVEYMGTGSGHAKLWRVPAAYSDDGYYIGVYQDTEIEPVPACAVKDAEMLCHARIESNNNAHIVKVVERIEEADCHA